MSSATVKATPLHQLPKNGVHSVASTIEQTEEDDAALQAVLAEMANVGNGNGGGQQPTFQNTVMNPPSQPYPVMTPSPIPLPAHGPNQNRIPMQAAPQNPLYNQQPTAYYSQPSQPSPQYYQNEYYSNGPASTSTQNQLSWFQGLWNLVKKEMLLLLSIIVLVLVLNTQRAEDFLVQQFEYVRFPYFIPLMKAVATAVGVLIVRYLFATSAPGCPVL